MLHALAKPRKGVICGNSKVMLYSGFSVYYKWAFQKAIIDYQNLTAIYLSEENTHFVCTFENCKYNVDLTIREFENYVIGLCAKGL